MSKGREIERAIFCRLCPIDSPPFLGGGRGGGRNGKGVRNEPSSRQGPLIRQTMFRRHWERPACFLERGDAVGNGKHKHTQTHRHTCAYEKEPEVDTNFRY